MQFFPGQTAIYCRLTLEASSPNSHQLQRIYLNKSWAETLLGFCPRVSFYQPLLLQSGGLTWKKSTPLFLIFSQLNSLDFMQLLITKCTLRRSALKCLLFLFFLESVFPFQEYLTALHGWSHFSLNVEVFELVIKTFFAPSIYIPLLSIIHPIQPYHETSAEFMRIMLTLLFLIHALGYFLSALIYLWKVDLLLDLKDGDLLRTSSQLPEVKGRLFKASH